MATIGLPNPPALALAPGWDGPRRVVDTARGPLRFYWEKFDVPQVDADRDGPYQEAESDARALEGFKS
jgi:hypothetical protein